MAVQTVKFGGKRFVIVPEQDYRDLKAKAARTPTARKSRKLTAQERGDVAEARRRLDDSADKEIPYEQARRELGLA